MSPKPQLPQPRDYIQAGLGYGLSVQSRVRYQQKTEIELRDQQAVEKLNRLIEWAFQTYETVKAQNVEDIRKYTDITLNWSPERVLSTYKYFEGLCRYFKEERAWKKLSRGARKFLATAYNQYVPPRTVGLVHK